MHQHNIYITFHIYIHILCILYINSPHIYNNSENKDTQTACNSIDECLKEEFWNVTAVLDRLLSNICPYWYDDITHAETMEYPIPAHSKGVKNGRQWRSSEDG